MYKRIAMLIIGACVAGCATNNSAVNFSMWRSSAISGEDGTSEQNMGTGGSLTADVPLK